MTPRPVWRCRHDKTLTDCSICFYDLPAHMRAISEPIKRAQAERYLKVKYQSVKDFGGGKHTRWGR